MTEKLPRLDLETARRLVTEVVEAQGADFVYNPDGVEQCIYAPLTKEFTPFKAEPDPDDPRTKTGCLVGRVLDAHGHTFHREIRGDVEWIHQQHPGTFTDGAAAYLREAQYSQDGGDSWGDARTRAERWLEEEGGG